MLFEQQALDTFRFQAENCAPYRQYIDLLDIDPATVNSIDDIPYLPIETFRTHRVYCATTEPQLLFSSSGTTGADTSHHYVASAELYEQSILDCFTHFYGDPSQYSLKTLLPSYRDGSSLLYMVRFLAPLFTGDRTLMIGVTFALLDEARSGRDVRLRDDSILIVTGGMKGHGQEPTQQELHTELTTAFGIPQIHSEYGMCELLSQAYSLGNGIFSTPPSMQIRTRNLHNPLTPCPHNQIGGINIIDLNNRHSCSFIATGDMGISHPNNTFQILGRIPTEIPRGCNMLSDQ